MIAPPGSIPGVGTWPAEVRQGERSEALLIRVYKVTQLGGADRSPI